MDLKLRDHNFKEVQINKNRHFHISVYHYKYSDELKRHKIVCHVYFTDRLKIYDLDLVVQNQILAIKEFLKENRQYNYDNTVYYLLMELTKGLSFSPDLRTLRLFTTTKFEAEDSSGIILSQIVGLIPEFYTKIMNIISKSFFGFRKGEAYDYANNYQDALDRLDKFNTIIRRANVPEFVEDQIT